MLLVRWVFIIPHMHAFETEVHLFYVQVEKSDCLPGSFREKAKASIITTYFAYRNMFALPPVAAQPTIYYTIALSLTQKMFNQVPCMLF